MYTAVIRNTVLYKKSKEIRERGKDNIDDIVKCDCI